MRRKHWPFFNHWRAKLGSLVLATVLWLVIKRGITHIPPAPSSPADVSTARP